MHHWSAAEAYNDFDLTPPQILAYIFMPRNILFFSLMTLPRTISQIWDIREQPQNISHLKNRRYVC
jgi:hypothetical protein